MEYAILLASLLGVVFGADFLVAGAVAIARKYKVSDFVIGAAIVGVGTSMPEFVVSFLGALNGNTDVAIGNVVGSNIFNVLGILGLTAMFFPVAVDKKNMKFEMPLCIFVSLLLTVLAFNFFDGSPTSIGRLDGLVLLGVFAAYMWYSFSRDKKENAVQAVDQPHKKSSLGVAILKVVGGLALLITSCDFFVDSAVSIARAFGVDDAFISLTLIACGTSLPELAASVAAAMKKNTNLALGNIIGSNIFNITLILGLSSQVTTLVSAGISYVDYATMIAVAILPVLIGLRGKIGLVGGLFMVICFAMYNWYLITNQSI